MTPEEGAAVDVVVKTTQGQVRGVLDAGIASFRGIPYASPPFGANRFLAPRRRASWEGVLDASSFAPTAPHGPYSPPTDELLPEPIISGENCLNLNVWTPDVGQSSLPVMVWIHGGAFVNGSGAVPWYAGDRFARDGVVCVTINYRLGADGFLLLDGVPANRGLLDQLAALEWVQENVAAFGGDPRNVTIFGESAGAMSVTSLLSMPRSRGLVRRAIAQSGAGHHVLSVDTARLVASELARRCDVDPTAAGLASVPVDTLVAAQQRLSADIATTRDRSVWHEIALDAMPFEPVVDGDVLAARPIDAIASGAAADVDLLVGTNLEEYRLFLVPNGVMPYIDDTVLAGAADMLSLDSDGLAMYRTAVDTPGEGLAAVLTDWYFRIPAVRLAELHRGTSHVYEFAWRCPLYEGRLGACHALEIAFAFDTLTEPGVGPFYDTAPQELATAMHAAWVGFATSGDPGWVAYEASSRATMTFGPESGVTYDPRSAERLVWEGRR
jgi:para-nitrobenzyl esterase